MNKLLTLVLFIVPILFSCQETAAPVTPADNLAASSPDTIEIDYGQRILLPDEQITVQFNDVLEDSRCPEGVVCFWAGNAKVAIQVGRQITNLNTYLDPKQDTVSTYVVELISVDPYPVYGQDTEKEDYVVRVRITKH